jgi:hypothetical protein
MKAEKGKYFYLGCCINFTSEDISRMEEDTDPGWPPDGKNALAIIESECTGFDKWCEIMGYSDMGLPVDQDRHLQFGKSLIRGIPCYWVSHSRIEYIWANTLGMHPQHFTPDSLRSNPGTMTGRLSSKLPNLANRPGYDLKSPNLQQIPRTDQTPEERRKSIEKLKSYLRALGIQVPDFKYDDIDYSELEERVSIQLTEEEKKELRNEAKVASFARRYTNYGKGPVEVLAQLQVNEVTAEEMIRKVRARFPALHNIPFAHVSRQESGAMAAADALRQAALAEAGLGTIIHDTEILQRMDDVIPINEMELRSIAKALLEDQDKPAIAVSDIDMDRWGCPHCGYHQGQIPLTAEGTFLWVCVDCKQSCHVLVSGLDQSTISTKGDDVYPSLQPHPRHGTKKRTELRDSKDSSEGGSNGSEGQ